MSTDTNSNAGNASLAIQAGDKNGVVTGSGTLALKIADKSTLSAEYTDAGNSNTKVTLSAGESFALFHGDNLAFDGHVDLDPRNGATTTGATMTFTIPNEAVVSLQGQIGAGGPSASLNLQIPL